MTKKHAVVVPSALNSAQEKPLAFNSDYYAGAEKTILIWDFFPDKVNVKRAKSLPSQNTLTPLGYVGDRANFEKGSEKELLQTITNETTQGLSTLYL